MNFGEKCIKGRKKTYPKRIHQYFCHLATSRVDADVGKIKLQAFTLENFLHIKLLFRRRVCIMRKSRGLKLVLVEAVYEIFEQVRATPVEMCYFLNSYYRIP